MRIRKGSCARRTIAPAKHQSLELRALLLGHVAPSFITRKRHQTRDGSHRSPSVVETYVCYHRRKVDGVATENGSTVTPLTHTRRGVKYLLRLARP